MDYVNALEWATEEVDSVLDVGCGNNSPLGRFVSPPRFSVGVETWRPWLDQSREKGIHSRYVEADVRDLDDHFGPAEFEVVMACDLLEHLEKVDGRDLLRSMQRIASRKVIVLTPNGFVEQGATWGNPNQAHRSGWSATEFRRFGFQVYGLSGAKILRGGRGRVRLRPARAWNLVSGATQPFAWYLPGLAFHLLAVRAVD